MTTTFSIQQTAQQTGLTAHTLRYYERIGLLRPIGRDDAGHRFYTQGDLEWIELVMRLRATGMSIQTIKEYADLQTGRDPTGVKRRLLLEEHEERIRNKVAELDACLSLVRYKIENYKKIQEEGP